MDRRVLVGIAVAIVLVGGAGIAIFGAPVKPDPASERTPSRSALELSQVEEANETRFQATVFENGDARWTVEYRQRITTEQERENFEQFAEQFNTTETETFTNFKTRANRLTEDGTRLTGRQMNATEFQREALYLTSPNPAVMGDGVIRMSFRWTGFAEQRGQQVVVSDVFDGGFVILENQQFRIVSGENVSFDSVSPTPDRVESGNASNPGSYVEWNGYREFESGAIDVRLSPPDVSPDGADGQSGDGSATPTDDANSGSGMTVPIILALLVLLGVGGTAVWYTMSGTADSDDEGATESAAEPQPAADSQADLDADQLLSDEDRVLKLLEENGGRMRQVTIVEETDWSKSKVSMLLSEMEDEGEISKLRVGRENIISLAGEEPEAAGSPFDEEE
ncbi:hypothetical protein GRX03_07380 [Halovenus sp. WSH3]|uniref:HTH iclR-type domain-containing protein n=1 Tax=Halovenus carboxidivorans TaxID=2692199 RepID=A0A6B0T0B2_9EURY|nr:helix-turn-helix domain-containing protein [Halovenus carboxidivorans]MXR51424.1 hypothetical protein [Halovenus carboxidivorans]